MPVRTAPELLAAARIVIVPDPAPDRIGTVSHDALDTTCQVQSDGAVQAIAAGCDAVLICSGDVGVQADALEALVHAVEDGRIPYKRLEDALKRLRHAKERFLAAPVGSGRSARLQHVLGCDAHQRIAEEMARFL